VELGILPSALLDEPPELLEALAAYLDLKASQQRSEALRQRLAGNLGG
jgi:hypothetical protein